MNYLELVFPQKEHEALWHNIIDEFIEKGERVVPYSLKLGCEDYDEFLRKTTDFCKGDSLPEGYVPSTTYFLMDNKRDKILATVNIRYYLNEFLLKYGGHIGYGVAPGERRKGYATQMLALAREECGRLGIEKILVTCDKDNIGSAKTILKNGGVLENEVVEADGNIVQRYWMVE